MSDIQQARDVLAKWRERATEGPWRVIDGVYSQEGMTYDGSQIEAEHEMVAMDHQDLDCGPVAPLGYADARLIVGTAGNPDLLDAIDEMLRIADTRMARREEPAFVLHADRIAAAIIAADERMSA
ncbi:hypothetical protein DEI99_005110 [Curtobacterium sp. MCLR17_036]|uniref:hypothetical protein n=1 Tax=Curtobacterium sp. MCLR17_036 TaxID=2175620 RepID=UPI000DAA3431|nr:hypothetical protein [Curtobacterium sp. MCLR17_036]WIE65918.1 hypothetical protein DEI99_005110 [Curtobacterium sp. MCLR17_036]